MKKLFLTLLLSLFLVSNAWAISPAFLDLISSGGGSSACDDCSGSLKFAWHMEDNDSTPDVTLGIPCGCSDGDTIGAELGSPDFSTTQKSDGSRSLYINALDEYYEFAVSADDIIEPDNCKITFDIYIVSYPTGTGLFEIIRTHYDFNNFLRLFLLGPDNKIRVYHIGQGISDKISVVVNTGSWVSCEYQAKTGISGFDHYLKCGETTTEEDDDLVALISTTSYLRFGNYYGVGAGEYYLDNIKVDICDRY